jgi:hypothetical protein
MASHHITQRDIKLQSKVFSNLVDYISASESVTDFPKRVDPGLNPILNPGLIAFLQSELNCAYINQGRMAWRMAWHMAWRIAPSGTFRVTLYGRRSAAHRAFG